MKTVISELLKEDVKPSNGFKTSIMINSEDALFLQAIAETLGTTRAKLLKKAIRQSCVNDYLYLQSAKPELLDQIMEKLEGMAHDEEFESMVNSKEPIYTTYGLDQAGIVPIYQAKGEE